MYVGRLKLNMQLSGAYIYKYRIRLIIVQGNMIISNW